jgi:Mn2+/Fe2+ NRAMP family transporter
MVEFSLLVIESKKKRGDSFAILCVTKTTQYAINEAKAFYAVLSLSTAIGLLLNFIGINPIQALVWSAIVNGVTAAPIMGFIMLMASSRKVMGKFALPLYLKIFGWGATLVMAAAAVGMFWPGSK